MDRQHAAREERKDTKTLNKTGIHEAFLKYRCHGNFIRNHGWICSTFIRVDGAFQLLWISLFWLCLVQQTFAIAIQTRHRPLNGVTITETCTTTPTMCNCPCLMTTKLVSVTDLKCTALTQIYIVTVSGGITTVTVPLCPNSTKFKSRQRKYLFLFARTD